MRYIYFVSYIVEGGRRGRGRINTDKEICTFDDILDIEKTLENDHRSGAILLMNYQFLGKEES